MPSRCPFTRANEDTVSVWDDWDVEEQRLLLHGTRRDENIFHTGDGVSEMLMDIYQSSHSFLLLEHKKHRVLYCW